MAKNFKHLLEKMPPVARARAEAKSKKMLEEQIESGRQLAKEAVKAYFAKWLEKVDSY
jgi:hypothetical protein